MKIARAILPLLMLVALIGAPFGMGRMMDGQANHSAIHQMAGMAHGMDQGSTPAHEPSAPHYMVCSACVAGPVLNIVPVRIALEDEAPRLPHSKTLNGTRYLPPVPPPRA